MARLGEKPMTAAIVRRTVLALGLIAATLSPSGTATAAPRQQVQFASVTVERLSILLEHKVPPDRRVMIAGTLGLPEGDGPWPAMVIAHGSGGIGQREADWSRVLEDAGVATLVVDSFGPRGVRETATDQDRLGVWNNVVDALAALNFLASDPHIDRNRIGVIGFSRGASVALKTALEPLRAVIADGDARFAVHVALYPPCNVRYVASRVTGAPIALLLAEKDDYTPIQTCDGFADWFRAQGAPVSVHIYPGAYHGFDGPGFPRWYPALDNFARCEATFDIGTWTMIRGDRRDSMSSAATRDYLASCRQSGATVGGTGSAARQAHADVLAFLRAHGMVP
jgi:dienelactone hydrolase